MGELRQVVVPDIGNFDAVAVIEVLVKAGDEVKKETSLITLESDKATMDVPSPFAGRVQEIKVKAGDKIGQGALILTLEASAEEEAGPPPAAAIPPPAEQPAPPLANPQPNGIGVGAGLVPAQGGDHKGRPYTEESRPQAVPGVGPAYASPAVRRFARELGADLGKVTGTGRGGRILREDIQAFVKAALQRPAGGGALPSMPVIDFSRFGAVEMRPLSRIQKIGGQHLHRSWLHVPHVTQFDDADITELEAFRQGHAAEAQEQGFKLTLLAFLLKAVAAGLRAFPAFNASLAPDGENLVLKKYFHVGVAVDTPEGLIVPVLRDVDCKGLYELAAELGRVSAAARERKLKPEDLQGGCFTISSLGGIGGTAFTPIVNAPEVAILGVSRAVTRPVYRDGTWVPRLVLPLSLSYDHRVIDGALAARFITHLSQALADIRRLVL